MAKKKIKKEEGPKEAVHIRAGKSYEELLKKRDFEALKTKIKFDEMDREQSIRITLTLASVICEALLRYKKEKPGMDCIKTTECLSEVALNLKDYMTKIPFKDGEFLLKDTKIYKDIFKFYHSTFNGEPDFILFLPSKKDKLGFIQLIIPWKDVKRIVYA